MGGAALLGLSPIGMRLSELGPQATNFWRFVLALPILAAWAVATGQANSPELGRRGWLLLAGLLFGVELSLWAAALSLTTVANATLLVEHDANLRGRVRLVRVQGAAQGRDLLAAGRWRWRGRWCSAIARARAGVGPAASAAEGLIGDALGFSAAIGYAGYLLIVRSLAGQVSTGAVMFWASLSAAVYALGLSLLFGEQLLPTTWRGWAVLAMLGIVVQAAAQGLIAYGVARLPIVVSTMLLWMQPLSAAVISWVLFGERARPARIRGRSAHSCSACSWCSARGASRAAA